MAVQKMPPSRLGFSNKVEAAFGDYKDTYTDYAAFNFEGGPIEQQVHDYYANDDEVTGAYGPDYAELKYLKIEAERLMKNRAQAMGIVLSSICPTISSALAAGESTIYKHVMKLQASALQYRSRNMLVVAGDHLKQYSGIVITGFKLTGERTGYLKLTPKIRGFKNVKNSSMTKANMDTQQAAFAESLFKFGDVQFKRGTSYTFGSDTVNSPTTFASVISFELDVDVPGEFKYEAGDSSKYVSSADPTGLQVALKARFELNSMDDHLDHLLAQTSCTPQLLIQGAVIAGASNSTKYETSIVITKSQVRASDPVVDNNKIVRDVEFQPIFTAENPILVATIHNKQASWTAN